MKTELIEQLIEGELQEVDAKWPNYHSHHEAYAVIKEEVEECEENMEGIKNELKLYWDCIKGDMTLDSKSGYLDGIKVLSKGLIKEAVQVYVIAKRVERLCKK